MKRTTYIKTFAGGSHSITVLMADEKGKYFIRKMAPLEHSKKLKAQAQWLRKFEGLRQIPRVIRASPAGGVFQVDIEYFDDAEPFLRYIETHPTRDSLSMLNRIVRFNEKNILPPRTEPAPFSVFRKYCAQKVTEKVAECEEMLPQYRRLFDCDSLEINASNVLNIHKSLNLLLAVPEVKLWFSKIRHGNIHGDLTVENILIRKKDFVLLDPNDENLVSDVTVEYGKIFQSLHSCYEYFEAIDDLSVKGCKVWVTWPRSARFLTLFRAFEYRVLKKWGPERLFFIYFHEAIHFARLLPYKALKSPNLFPAYYARTAWLFDRLLVKLGERPDV